MRINVPLSKLLANDRNLRGELKRVPELAESINEHGLLQNLVVDREGDLYRVRAGSRRHAALIYLQQRVNLFDGKGIRPETKQLLDAVPCLIIESQADIVNLVENVHHESPYPWEIGRRYAELYDSGLTQVQIASRAGISQVKVSQYLLIAQGLAERSTKAIVAIGFDSFSLSELIKLSRLVDEDGYPQEEEQVLCIERKISSDVGRKKRNRHQLLESGVPEHFRVYSRYQLLAGIKRQPAIPTHARPYVEAMVRYLSGEDRRLSFPKPPRNRE